MKVGDLVKTIKNSVEVVGVVIRGGEHSAFVRFCFPGNSVEAWMSVEYLELVSESR